MISKNVENMIPKIQQFFGSQPIKKAWLFGSCSRGEESMDSDVDREISARTTRIKFSVRRQTIAILLRKHSQPAPCGTGSAG